MVKKHIKGLEVREVVGEIEKNKFIARSGLKVKDRQVKQMTPDELNRANREDKEVNKDREI